MHNVVSDNYIINTDNYRDNYTRHYPDNYFDNYPLEPCLGGLNSYSSNCFSSQNKRFIVIIGNPARFPAGSW